MKIFFIFVSLFIFQNCSFDNKSGIWNNIDNNLKKNDKVFKEFKTISSTEKRFNEIIPIKKNYSFELKKAKNNLLWHDIYFNSSNNVINLKYNNSNSLIFKSKKLSRNSLNKFLLFENDNLILNDEKGNLIIYSIAEKQVVSEFNFYKKRFKKIKKSLNVIVENNTIYVSDNIGYLYAYNYVQEKILWAKNYDVPFRSNLKVTKDKLIASNQNNQLYFFDKKTGDILRLIPTEETIVKNDFINNLSLYKDTIYFLNTYGSLYSIDSQSMRINWFINLNKSLDLNLSSLFLGTQIVINDNKLVVSSDQNTYVIDSTTGSIIYKKKFSSKLKPFISNNHLFLISKNNLLILINLNNGQIVYSYDVNEEISKFLKIKKRKVAFKDMLLVNGELFIFLKNSYVLNFKVDGKLKKVFKLPSNINTQPIIVDNSLVYFNSSNKLLIID